MRQWSDTKRVRLTIGIALVVAALVTPAAQAGQSVNGGPLDPWAVRVIEYGPHADPANVSPDSRAVDFRTYRSDDVGPLDPWAVRVIEAGARSSPDSRAVDFRTPSGSLSTFSPTAGDDFQWGDAGIGAGAMFTLVVLLAGAGTLLARRNHGRLASR